MAEPAHGSIAACLHCGLPLRRPKARFCCYGCSIAYDLVGTHQKEERGSVLILMRLGIAAFLAVNVMILTWASYGEQLPILFPVEDFSRQALHYIALLLSLPIFILVGLPYLRNAWREILARTVGVDTLIAVGTTSAFLVSVYGTVRGSEQVYFDTASMVLVLVTFGRYLEASARLRAASLLHVYRDAIPQNVRRIAASGDETIPVASVLEGDYIRILAGEQIPVDGVIVEGETSVNEALLTGEPLPVARTPGERVLGGSVNHDGTIIIRATTAAGETFASRLAELVDKRLSESSNTQKVMDSVASWFTPLIIVIAAAASFYAFFMASLPPGDALLRFLSVLLIACPCAIGIGTSLAESVAFHTALQGGVLCKSLDTLEDLGSVKVVVFDKTGTVTRGEAVVTDLIIAPGACISRKLLLGLAVALERHAEHPFGRAVVAFGAHHPTEAFPQLSDVHLLPGKGISASVSVPGNGRSGISIQRVTEAQHLSKRLDLGPLSAGTSMASFYLDEELQGVFLFRDRMRDEAPAVVATLRRRQVATILVSGDTPGAVEAVAVEAGIPRWQAGMLPDSKAAMVSELGKHEGVAMVGDGINDAPALAAATCGVAFNAGADLSRQAADVIILGSSLRTVPWLLRLGRETVSVIRWNTVWMFMYNAAGVALAAAGFLHPVFSALAMVGSSGMIIANSSRLAHRRAATEDL